jgi:ribonuclease HI
LKLNDEQSEWLLARARELGVGPEAAALDLLEGERRKAPAAAVLDLFGSPVPALERKSRASGVPSRSAAVPVPVAMDSAPDAAARPSREAGWKVWSDGACSGNPGPGGWGTIVQGPEGREELSGGWRHTTNNRMEMMGAIVGLESVPRGERVVLVTDSRYVVDAIEKKWLPGWKRKGWRKADGGPVANVDLWQALEAAMAGKFVRLEWVRGHNGHAENERCDVLAVTASKRRDLPSDPA